MRVRQSGTTLQLPSPKGSISGTLPIIGLMARQASDLSRISIFRTFPQHAARILNNVGEEHMALVIFDTFKGHKGDEMESLSLENNMLSVIVPSNCTDLLQPLDRSVNKPHLRHSFQSWYSEQVSKQLEEGKEPVDIKVDARLSIMKPLGAKWITSALRDSQL